MIIECAIAVISVIILLMSGIFIGKEFGTFEKFVIAVLKSIDKNGNIKE